MKISESFEKWLNSGRETEAQDLVGTSYMLAHSIAGFCPNNGFGFGTMDLVMATGVAIVSRERTNWFRVCYDGSCIVKPPTKIPAYE